MIISHISNETMGGWRKVFLGGTDEEFELLYWAFKNMPEETMKAIGEATVEARIQENFDQCRKLLNKMKDENND